VTDQIPLPIDEELYRRAFGQLDGPIHWPSLTAEERTVRSDELRDWVEKFGARFDIDVRVIPPCWQRHEGMVESLSALRDHERASYADTATPTAAVDWLRAHYARSSNGCMSSPPRPNAPPKPIGTASSATGKFAMMLVSIWAPPTRKMRFLRRKPRPR